MAKERKAAAKKAKPVAKKPVVKKTVVKKKTAPKSPVKVVKSTKPKKKGVVDVKQVVKLTDSEKNLFAQRFCALRQKDPNLKPMQIIAQVRDTFPEDRRISTHINSFKQASWMPEYIEKFEKSEISKPTIDSRQKFYPPTEEPQTQSKVRGTPKGSTKVRFSIEERRRFAETVFYIKRGRPELTWEDVINEAKETLPPHRRPGRNVKSLAHLPWLRAELDAVHEADMVAREKAKLEEQKQAQQIQPQTPPQATSLENILVNALLGSLQNPEAAARLQETLLQRLGGSPKPVQAVQSSQPQIKKKVMIVGIQPIQQQEVQREWARHFDFKFFDNTVTADRVKSALPGVDHAIIMTKFVSHATQAAMRGHPGFRFCNGTIVAAKQILEEIHNRK